MNRRKTLAFLGLATALSPLAGCGGPPPPAPKPPPVLSLLITGGADQNPDAAGRASPVAVRVYQLSGTAKFEQTDVFALKDREALTLGTESQGSQEFLIAPGEKRTVSIALKPLVSAIGVAVMYRDIDHAAWRAARPANPHGQTKLSASVGRLTLALRTETPDPPPLPEKPEADAAGLLGAAKGVWEKVDNPVGRAAGSAAETAAGKLVPQKK